ncbi:Control of competence regulator ComK, YlbF/YmcA [Lachnospiraceae bacterium RM5]|nr:Control of competence regulator ComK, YlbF/YmcA [Lachnospiraceae bacterium RM5]
MEDNILFSKAEELKNLLFEREEYKDYISKKEKIKEQSTIYSRVLEFEKRKFEMLMRNTCNGNEAMEYLKNEFMDILVKSEVQEYLNAEVIFAGLIKKVESIIFTDICKDVEII